MSSPKKPNDDGPQNKRPNLPESTLRIMERMVKTPPDPKKPKGEQKPKKEKPAK